MSTEHGSARCPSCRLTVTRSMSEMRPNYALVRVRMSRGMLNCGPSAPTVDGNTKEGRTCERAWAAATGTNIRAISIACIQPVTSGRMLALLAPRHGLAAGVTACACACQPPFSCIHSPSTVLTIACNALSQIQPCSVFGTVIVHAPPVFPTKPDAPPSICCAWDGCCAPCMAMLCPAPFPSPLMPH